MRLEIRHWKFAALGALSVAAASIGFASPGTARPTKPKVLYVFCAQDSCRDGSHPSGDLIIDSAQALYGTTTMGGQFGAGTVYKIIHNTVTGTHRHIVLYDFCNNIGCADGGQPVAGTLILDTDGSLYGTASMGGPTGGTDGAGVVYKLTPNAHHTAYTYSILYNFCRTGGCTDGMTPTGNLTYAGAASGALYDKTSPLYGSTVGGGGHNAGVVFSLTPQTGGTMKEVPLYFFCSKGGSNTCSDGKNPNGGIGIDDNGNIGGTTALGGNSNAGLVFRLTPSGKVRWTETVLHAFCAAANCPDGMSPGFGVQIDRFGNIFGTTTAGGNTNAACGAQGCGVAFKIDPNGVLTQLHAFCSDDPCSDGGLPARLTVDTFGNPVGMTRAGGKSGAGTLYQMNNGFQVLTDFKCKTNKCVLGEAPDGGITADANNNLYGTLSERGRNNGGSVFTYAPMP